MKATAIALLLVILPLGVLSAPINQNDKAKGDNIKRQHGIWGIQEKAASVHPKSEPELGSENATSVINGMLEKYNTFVTERLDHPAPNSTCTRKTAIRRKEWSTMSASDRTSYIAALQCMTDLPPQTAPDAAPGVRNRYDDYLASHLRMTDNVHFNGIFHPWHRHFLWQYDQDMRTQCNYTGPTPYWDWTLNADARTSAVLDGGPLSLGGNGATVRHGVTDLALINRRLIVEPVTGGGCVDTGPLAGWEVRMGNLLKITNVSSLTEYPGVAEGTHAFGPALGLPLEERYDVNAALEYRPRCLKRDINPNWGALLNVDAVAYLLACEDSACFAARDDGFESDVSAPWNALNLLHTAGHLSLGGLNNDVYASAGDPVFYLHHGMVDRLWTIWQAQELGRIEEVGGTVTAFNDPASDSVSADALLEYPGVGETLHLADTLDTLGGEYCYYYD